MVLTIIKYRIPVVHTGLGIILIDDEMVELDREEITLQERDINYQIQNYSKTIEDFNSTQQILTEKLGTDNLIRKILTT